MHGLLRSSDCSGVPTDNSSQDTQQHKEVHLHITAVRLGMAATQVFAAFENDGSSGHSSASPVIGNPEPNAVAALVRFAGGFTIGAWSFVPSYITVELANSMAEPRLFRKSLLMAGGLNLAMFLGAREQQEKLQENSPQSPGLSGNCPGIFWRQEPRKGGVGRGGFC